MSQTSQCSEITVTFQAITQIKHKTWNIQTDIAADELKALVGHQSVPIVSLAFVKPNNRMVLLLDKSGSMEDKWQQTLSAASDLSNRLPAIHPLGLIVFAEKIEDRVGVDQPRDTVAQHIQALAKTRARGKTALFEAMTEAVAMLAPVRPGDALFLISDGQDTKFKLSTDKVDRMLVDAGVRLFALVPVEPGPQPPEQNGGAAAMLRFVKATGGDMAMLNEPEQMASALPVALAQALHFYQVRLRLSHSITKSTSFELEFTKSARQRRRDTHLVYPEAMRACSP